MACADAAGHDVSATFRDHFAPAADAYATYRPHYPPALFDWIAAAAPRTTGRAWDCGTGSGQAALGLARAFDAVVATDASAAQVARAAAHPRVHYVVSTAEACAIASRSVDAVVVAQALHWMGLDAFYAEVRRVVVPGGVAAAWTYGLMEVDASVDPLVRHLYHDVLGPWWPAERASVDTGYRDLPFPFAPLDAPAFEMRHAWTRDQLVGYLGTWSAVLRRRAALGDPLPAFARTLAAAWPRADERRVVRWPLAMRAGRVA